MKPPSIHLTASDCVTCGHRHKIEVQPNGTLDKGRCWLCSCKKHLEPTTRRKMTADIGEMNAKKRRGQV